MLARAQASLARAAQQVAEAITAVQRADEQYRTVLNAPGSGSPPLDWYRSWRVRLTGDRQRCEAVCRAREAEAHEAAAAVARTRQRVKSLERLHDNALAAWKQALHHEEQKTMDALATLRFTGRGKDAL